MKYLIFVVAHIRIPEPPRLYSDEWLVSFGCVIFFVGCNLNIYTYENISILHSHWSRSIVRLWW